jgi:RimJ/RimL family protein N-acetyltransferase
VTGHLPTFRLETERLILRELGDGDLDHLVALLGDPDVMRFYPHPKTREEARGWLDWNLGLYAERGHGLWAMVLKDTGEFVGECGLTPQPVDGSEEIEIGWHVRKDLWRKGFASEAATACLRYGFDQMGLDRIVSIIAPANVASHGVATKIGMTLDRTSVWEKSGLPEHIFVIKRPPPAEDEGGAGL